MQKTNLQKNNLTTELQTNQNSVEHTELYEDKNTEILEKDAIDVENKQKIPKEKVTFCRVASVGDLVSQMYKLKTELQSTKSTLKFA